MSASRKSLRDPSRPPLHPGVILAEVVVGDGGIEKEALAAALGTSNEVLEEVLTEKHPITVAMAVKLGHVFGNGPGIWLRMQQAYDLWHAERSAGKSKLRVLSGNAAA